jgi:hypothetical protein
MNEEYDKQMLIGFAMIPSDNTFPAINKSIGNDRNPAELGAKLQNLVVAEREKDVVNGLSFVILVDLASCCGFRYCGLRDSRTALLCGSRLAVGRTSIAFRCI